jgi:hypothetical protein
MKKMLILLFLIFVLAGCRNKEEEDFFLFEPLSDDFTYYQATVFNEDRHLFVFGQENGRRLSRHELITGQAIQGLFARDEVRFYLSLGDENYEYWLSEMVRLDQVTYERTTLETMIQMYKSKFLDHGYILYDEVNRESVNVATSLAGLYGYIPIEKNLETLAVNAGLDLKIDVTERSERWAFDQYKDQFDWSGLVQLRHDIPHMRDYGVTFKYFYFYQDSLTTAAINFRDEIHRQAKVDAPLFGWGPFTEDSHIGIASRNGQFTIPSDYSYNTTVFSARNFFGIPTIMPNHANDQVVATSGKHYVAIVRSDGDNIQTWYNYFPFHVKDMAAPRTDFKMGWSIQPSLIDLAPNIIRDAYETADVNDYFVAAVSGHGYMYPSLYPDLKSFIQGLDVYLRRTGLNIVQILDSGPDQDVIEWYSRIPSLKGVMYMYGLKYAGGLGSIRWSENGKPFVSFRESLWDSDPLDIATRVNGYLRDFTSIEGYTLINLHPWSHSYQDVERMVELFQDHVVVVSPEKFFDLIIEHVPKEDVILN